MVTEPEIGSTGTEVDSELKGVIKKVDLRGNLCFSSDFPTRI